MELTGHIKGRSIELDEDPGLPDGVSVRVVLSVEQKTVKTTDVRETLLRYAGTIQGAPDDLAERHDHCIYGEP